METGQSRLSYCFEERAETKERKTEFTTQQAENGNRAF